MRAACMSGKSPTKALLLAAHGSLKNGQSSDAVFEHAQRIREKGIFDEVREIFWKEEPYFHQAARIVGSDLIYVVPFFMSHGYFTRQILPRELRSSSSALSDRMIINQPLGTHPDMMQILLRQIQKAIPDYRNGNSAVALIGHGTPKDEQSSTAIYELAHQIQKSAELPNIKCFFLDEHPMIENIPQAFETDTVHIFPVFIGEGLHTQIDIPERLQLNNDQPVYGTHQIQDTGVTLNYHPPLGVLPESTDIIMQRLMESDETLDSPVPEGSAGSYTYLRPAAQFFLEQFNVGVSEKFSWGQ
ncbi:MAG: hypothetical protein GF372_11175, partial [Candidatus Marinimicrobia bacterium]|nr:hypothetical protein [Candidatus Neomarinimicrobiota bacterium]